MRGSGYYYGSYGLVRGYGPLCRTIREADDSIFADGKKQRQENRGSSDRVVVLVSPDTGQCWWAEDEEDPGSRLDPVLTPNGDQARYADEVIKATELLWYGPQEVAGFI